MMRPSKASGPVQRAVLFGLLPGALGLGFAHYVREADWIWLTDVTWFWPCVLAFASALILIRLAMGSYHETASAVFAWLTLAATWLYVPMWAEAISVPYAAAVVGRGGQVHLARDVSRYQERSVWLLTDRPGTRIVHNVWGKVAAGGLEITYSAAPALIASRRAGDDLAQVLRDAAGPVLAAAASGTRTAKIAILNDRPAQAAMLARVCRAAVTESGDCPFKMTLAPEKEAAAPNGLWSAQFSEREAIAERHVPTLVQMLTQADIAPVQRDEIFALFLEIAGSSALLAQVALKPHLIEDRQFDEIIQRILSSADCGDVAAAVATVNRLGPKQREALRTKALDEARIQSLVENAAALRLSDAELIRLGPRLKPSLLADAAVSVRLLDLFGARLPPETQRDAVDGILAAGSALHAITVLERYHASSELRHALVKKVLAEAAPEDFAAARISRARLQDVLTPAELRDLIAVAVRRAETSAAWHAFTIETLPVPRMTLIERRKILDGLMFNSTKAAMEFASKYRDFLDPAEVAQVTRDYSRTVTPDFCLHLSHRNANWRTNFFSEAQLEIFRQCAEGR